MEENNLKPKIIKYAFEELRKQVLYENGYFSFTIVVPVLGCFSPIAIFCFLLQGGKCGMFDFLTLIGFAKYYLFW